MFVIVWCLRPAGFGAGNREPRAMQNNFDSHRKSIEPTANAIRA